jgi:integrase/recombinase XerD
VERLSPPTALAFLGYLRRVPSKRPAQRLGLTVATGRLLSAATVARILAATSSFFDWAIAAEQYAAGENPMQRKIDHALGRVPERYQPFVGARAASSRSAARSGFPCDCHGR